MIITPQPHSVSAPPGPAGVLTPDLLGVSESRDRSPVPLFPSPAREAGLPPSGLVRPGGVIGAPVPLTVPRLEVIDPPANRLIDLLKRHYPAFEQSQPLPDHVRRAMRLVQACHTSTLGGHVERCPEGHISRVFYNSCGHRFCPRCAGRQRRKWLRARRAKHLPVRHDHAVFTSPHLFNELWRANFRLMGDLLFHRATDALRAFLADPKWLGAEPGMTATLETWDDRLFFHPHVHCLVTGGGLTPKGEGVEVANPRCFVAVNPLMWEFRKRFWQALKAFLKKAFLEQEQEQEEEEEKDKHEKQDTLTLPEGTTPRQWRNRVNKVTRQDWEVFISKPPEDGGPTTWDIEDYLVDDVAGGRLPRFVLSRTVSRTSSRIPSCTPPHSLRHNPTLMSAAHKSPI